jgi:hypothetical protein
MDGKEVGWKRLGSIHGVQERNEWWIAVNTVMNTWVPYKAEGFFDDWATDCSIGK